MRLLNNGASKLDHLITTSKSFSDHSGFGYKDESSGTKIVFAKFSLLADSVNVSYNKLVVNSVVKTVAIESKSIIQQFLTIGKSVKNSRQKRKGKIFVPICHFYGVKSYIRPRYFTLVNFLENHYEKTKFLRYFKKPTPNLRLI